MLLPNVALHPPIELGAEALYAVIGAVAQGHELERVLPPIVDLLSRATACHACFVYVRDGDILQMRAASTPYAHAVGRVRMGMDEGVCGWVATHRTPTFIREDALSDPRMKLFPELEEDRFQSMVAVPLLDRSDEAIGVVVLHTEAPREFGQDILDFLVHVASLVAGAIDAARLLEAFERQVTRLSALSAISHRLAAATEREQLYRLACDGVAELLGCVECQLQLAVGDRLEVVATSGCSGRGGTQASAQLTSPLAAGDERLGLLSAVRAERFTETESQLLDAVANQLAVALQKAELIERLTDESVIRDLFNALDRGDATAAAARARSAGYDLGRSHVVAVLEPHPDRRPEWVEIVAQVELRLRRTVPGALCDPGAERLRALLPVASTDRRGLAALDAELDRIAAEHGLTAGRSEPRSGHQDHGRGLAEATDAARIVHALLPDGGARGWDSLGVFRYLARTSDYAPDERHAAAIATLQAYDTRRGTELLTTLEHHLADRGGLLSTARSLCIHANTLRQRLERIETLTGLVLADEDLLGLELALKLSRLRH